MNKKPSGTHTARFIAIGAICGLAWAAGFRAYMAELAGPASAVGWWGTFGALLLPGTIVGGLLGWAEAIRHDGGRRGWRWLALAPLAFAVAPLLMPGAVVILLTQGLGGGAIAVALMGIGGGYALSRRGRPWTRLVCGLASAALLTALALAGPGIAGPGLAFTEPRGAWVVVLLTSFVVVLALAASIPHRPVLATTEPAPLSNTPRSRPLPNASRGCQSGWMTEQSGALVLNLECTLAAPPDRVFRMLTESSELVKWWGPHGFIIPAAEANLVVGGRYRFRMTPPDGEPFHLSGKYLEIDPPWRLVHTFNWEEPAPDDRETVVDLSLAGAGTGTRLVLSQGPFLTDERLELHRNGWTESFEKLRSIIETRG